MAAVELSNQLAVGGGKVVLLYKPGATTTVDKTLANLATGGETVTAADITRIWYTGAGTMHIRRNSTIVFVTDSEASLEWNLKESGTSNHSAA